MYHDFIAANYYQFLVIFTDFFRNYESTNCSLKITNFSFSTQQKKALDKVPFYEQLGKITYNDRKNQNRYPYWMFSYVSLCFYK